MAHSELSLIAGELRQVHVELHELRAIVEAASIVVTPEDLQRMEALKVQGRAIVRRLRRLDAQN